MSRLAASQRSPEEAEALHREIVGCVNDLLETACRRARRKPEQVYHVTAVGNSVMHHIFLGLPTESLARAPYRPASRRPEVRVAGPFGVRAHPEARVTAPPVVAAFVGSDLVAGVLTTRMHRAHGLRFIVDVGTNTEICAGDRERLIACSSPSGPAFEGAQIRFGMRAADGAIERVSISPDGGRVDYRTIGSGRPRGLCGSALIDLLADLTRTGILDRKGRFVHERRGDRLVSKDGRWAFVVAPASAREIGLFPPLPLDRVSFVGNTAGSGARLALVSRTERASMERLARTIRHLSLAEDPRFSRTFANSLSLPPMEPVLPTPLRRVRRRAAPRG